MATPELDPLSALELAADLGLAGVELIYQSGYRCGVDEAARPVDIGGLASRAASLGVRVGALTPYIVGLDDDDRDERIAAKERYRHAISVAHDLGATCVRVLAGGDRLGEARVRAVDLASESLRELAEFAEMAGVNLDIENHPRTLAVSASETAALVAAVDRAQVNVIFDPVNLLRERREDEFEGWRIQRARVHHIHMKDFFRDRAGEYVPTPLGEGSVHWDRLLPMVLSDGYAGWLSLEYERRWHPGRLPPAAMGLSRSARAIERWVS